MKETAYPKLTPMKKVLRIALLGIIIILLVAAAFVGWIFATKPNVGPPEEMTIERTPERIERGEYLANHVMLCMDCHAIRDYSFYSGPITPGTEGGGGEVFDQSIGFPGRFISPNITPHGLEDWTDGEIYRAITAGVTKDGRALFPVMPYPNYSTMDPEDIKSVIAYIRTITPVNVDQEPSKADFPVNIIMRTIPKKAEPGKAPDPSDLVGYGRYLVNAAACGECHTRRENGNPVGEFLAGGQAFPMPDGSVVTSHNLTPHPTGLGSWSKEQFINTFKKYADPKYQQMPVEPGDKQTLMPWIMYSGMTEADLGAIYEYLQTLDPVDNAVETYTPPQ